MPARAGEIPNGSEKKSRCARDGFIGKIINGDFINLPTSAKKADVEVARCA